MPLCIHTQHMLCVNAQDRVYLPFVFNRLLQGATWLWTAVFLHHSSNQKKSTALFKLPSFLELQSSFPLWIISCLRCAIRFPTLRHGVLKHANICIWGFVWQVPFVLMKRDTICMERSCLIISALISEQWKHGLKWNLQLSSYCV